VNLPAETSEFDWGDDSSLHRVGRGALVVAAFVGVFVVFAAVAGVPGFLGGPGGMVPALFVLCALAALVDFALERRRADVTWLAQLSSIAGCTTGIVTAAFVHSRAAWLAVGAFWLLLLGVDLAWRRRRNRARRRVPTAAASQ
jgi:hypothetical protein